MKKIIIFGANSAISKNFASDINVKKKFQILGIARQKTSKLKHFKKILKWDVLNENISDQVNKEIKLFNPDIIILKTPILLSALALLGDRISVANQAL